MERSDSLALLFSVSDSGRPGGETGRCINDEPDARRMTVADAATGQDRVILCATDAGGACNLAPLLPVLKAHELAVTVITRPRLLPLFDDVSGGRADRIVDGEDLGDERLLALLSEDGLRAVICGTTRYASPDRSLVRMARAAGIRITVVLDEWYAYRFRFRVPDTKEAVVFPDAIALQDEVALHDATGEAIPASICRITGGPSLSHLTSWAEGLRKEPPRAPKILDELAGRPVVTFLSETHAADFGSAPGEQGPLGAFIGYTETSVRQSVREVLERIGKPVVVVEKLHPSAESEIARPPATTPVDWRPVHEAHLWSLLWHSDLVLGMTSMALLEAAVLGRRTVSYQPGMIGEERCTAVRLGIAGRVESADELEAICEDVIGNRAFRRDSRVRRFPFAAVEAARNVVELALEGTSRS